MKKGNKSLARFVDPFSKKEHEIIQGALKDQDAPQKNIPVFIEIITSKPQLKLLLYPSFVVMEYISIVQQQYQAKISLSGNNALHEEIVENVVTELARRVNVNVILNKLIPEAKEAKIKREKRVLLWACSILLYESSLETPLEQATIPRALALASVNYAIEANNMMQQFVLGQEPFLFDYNKVADHAITSEELLNIYSKSQSYEPDFSTSIFSVALLAFEEIKRDFGMRFYQLLNFPFGIDQKKRKLILMPGESENQMEDTEEQNKKRSEAIHKGLQLDSNFWQNLKFATDMMAKIRTASFGQMDPKAAIHILNAVAYSLIIQSQWNPFLFRLYVVSAEKAETLNPQDELTYILDIKGSPENIEFFRSYAEHLYNKQEWEGAFITYIKVSEMQKQENPEVEERLEELQEKVKQQMKEAIKVEV